jgi:lipopolysaccharide biosynthesis glycosyltransferase
MKNGLVTVSNEEYLEGTKVLFYSFLEHNPRFFGDLIVIHNRLSPQKQDELAKLFKVKFVQIGNELVKAIENLVQEKKELKNRYQRFWSLEVFKLNQYDNLLFLDSDVLCRNSLQHLFNTSHGISACPDMSFYEGVSRDRISFQRVNSQVNSDQNILKSFNAGVFSICFSELSSSVYSELLDLIKGSVFSGVKSGHTDQYVLNVLFENKVNWLEVKYNYVLKNTKLIEDKTGISSEEAIVWHYIRHPKPWKLKRILKNHLKGKAIPPTWSEWHQAYRKALRLNNKKSYRVKNTLNRILSKVLVP